MSSVVSLTRGGDRYENVSKALELIASQPEELPERVLIKPNFVTVHRQLAATHVDATKAVVDFLEQEGVEEFLIAEGPAVGTAHEGFRNYNYYEAFKGYKNVRFADLNLGPWREFRILDSHMKPLSVRVSSLTLENWCVSVCPMKTHDTVIVTLSTKNLVVGSLIGSDKQLVHQNYPATNLNLFKLFRVLKPKLAVIDGTVGMEGDGPTAGDPVELGVALTSFDAVAADVVAAQLMGFDPRRIGYLWYAWRGRPIRVLGEELERCKRSFRAHSTYEQQLKWRFYAKLR